MEKNLKLTKWGGFCIGAVLLIVLIAAFSRDESVQEYESAIIQADQNSPEEATKTQLNQTNVPIEQQYESVINAAALMDLSMNEIAEQYGVERNTAGSVIYKGESYELLVESRDGTTPVYVQVEFPQLGSCKTDSSVISMVDSVLTLAGLNASERGAPTNGSSGVSIGAAEFCNYPSPYEIGVSCMYDGGSYDIGISRGKNCS